MSREKQLPLLSASGGSNCDGTSNILTVLRYWNVSISNDVQINRGPHRDSEHYGGKELPCDVDENDDNDSQFSRNSSFSDNVINPSANEDPSSRFKKPSKRANCSLNNDNLSLQTHRSMRFQKRREMTQRYLLQGMLENPSPRKGRNPPRNKKLYNIRL